MKRRGVLASITAGLAGLAGCGGTASDGGAPDRDPYDVPVTETAIEAEPFEESLSPGRPGAVFPPDDAVRSVRRVGGSPRTFAIGRVPTGTAVTGTTLTVGFTAPPTTTSPARVWVGLTNAGPSQRRLEFGPTPPFSGYHGRTAGDWGDMVLVPTNGESPSESGSLPDGPVDGEWVAATSVPGAADRRARTSTLTLSGGETVAREYYLLRAEETGGTPDRGIYRFGPDEADISLGIAVWDPRLEARSASRFAGSVPGLPSGDETEWFHAGDRPTFLAPRRERLSLPRDRTTFSLGNLSMRPLAAGDVNWGLYRRTNRGWRPIATGDGDGTLDRLPVGGKRRISLGVAGDATPPSAGDADTTIAASGLSPGTYALQFGSATIGSPTGHVTVHGAQNTYVWTPPPAPDDDEEGFPDGESVVYAALIRLVGSDGGDASGRTADATDEGSSA